MTVTDGSPEAGTTDLDRLPDTVGDGDPGTTTPAAPELPAEQTPSRWDRLRGAVLRLDTRLADPQVPIQLTLLLVILATDSSWSVAVPVVLLGVIGLIVPSSTGRMTFWLVLAGALAAAALNKRWQLDNHQFLIIYWCVALAMATTALDPARVRARAARILIGLVFLLAVFWKVVSPDFADGSFMRYTILTDTRFSEVASLVGGVPEADLAYNRRLRTESGRPEAGVAPLELRSAPRIDLLARGLSAWTFLIEGAVALTFLVPWRKLARFRDAALITFVLTTYAVAPVTGFGWVLVAMGISQADRDRRGIRVAYLAAFLAVQVFVAPWPRLFGLDM